MGLEPRRCLIPDLLDKLGWTQRQLSEHSGVHEKKISKYVTMKVRHMPLGDAIPIAEALGVTERMLYEWARE